MFGVPARGTLAGVSSLHLEAAPDSVSRVSQSLPPLATYIKYLASVSSEAFFKCFSVRLGLT